MKMVDANPEVEYYLIRYAPNDEFFGGFSPYVPAINNQYKSDMADVFRKAERNIHRYGQALSDAFEAALGHED